MATIDPDAMKEEGLQLFKRGAYDQALSTFSAAVDAYADKHDEIGRGEMLNNIGVIHRLQGNRKAAIEVLHQAEQVFQRIGEVNQQAQVLGNLGDLHAANRDQDQAAAHYGRAASLFAQIEDREKQSQVVRALSLTRLRQRRWLQALVHMEESLRVKPRLGVPQRLFRGLLRLALSLLSHQ